MGMTKLKLEERRDYRKARTIILKSNDPFMWVEEGGAETELWETMEGIYQYIKASLYMDDNPLRHLRKYFPDFEWKFYKMAGLEELAPIIAKADYIWNTHDDIFGSEGIVTATEKGRPDPRAMLYRHESEPSRPVQDKENLKLRGMFPNIKFVHSELGPGTVIK